MTAPILDRALRVIPGGSSTNAKSPLRSVLVNPPAAVSATGARFSDTEGRSWLDVDMAVGAVVWGHAHPAVTAAAAAQLARGVNFSAPSLLEVTVAELILDRLQVFDSVRFCKTGADAVSAAVRIARAATARERVICGSYHGWHDWAAYRHYGAAPELGIPLAVGALTEVFASPTAAAVREMNVGTAAAVVVCPEEWEPAELRAVSALSRDAGALLIFDEVKSGLRSGKHGPGLASGVIADLLCISKGLANGLPLAAVIGRRDLMQRILGTRFTGTYFGETLSLAAAETCESLLRACASWPSWLDAAEDLMTHASVAAAAAGSGLTVSGYPGCFRIGRRATPPADDPFRVHFIRTLERHGIYSAGWILLSDAHDAADCMTIAIADDEAIATWSGDAPAA